MLSSQQSTLMQSFRPRNRDRVNDVRTRPTRDDDADDDDVEMARASIVDETNALPRFVVDVTDGGGDKNRAHA